MRKKSPIDEPETRAKKREIKKRPRMKLHGAGLKKSHHEAGSILTRSNGQASRPRSLDSRSTSRSMPSPKVS